MVNLALVPASTRLALAAYGCELTIESEGGRAALLRPLTAFSRHSLAFPETNAEEEDEPA